MIISDLDDFILPSQICVNPLVGTTTASDKPTEEQPTGEKSTSGSSAGGVVRLGLASDLGDLAYEADAAPAAAAGGGEFGGRTGFGAIKTKAKDDAKVATISLADCLACSGCVTSAEEVLIQEQSYERLTDILAGGGSCVAVTLSPQSVASIAALLNCSLAEAFVALASMLKAGGVRYVFDASAGGDVSLVESGHEFLKR
jgi:hypothetical protein